MGFMDSFNKSKADAAKRYAVSGGSYKTVVDEDNAQYRSLKSESDGTLLRKINGGNLSSSERTMIDDILRKRGYCKLTNGRYGK